MSILINMEMPEGCQHCHFSCEYDVQDDVAYGCWLAMETRPINCYNRPDWCPLIEVPPHGDLIDRDALPTSRVEWEDIVNAPTIIEADESDMDSFIRIFEEDDEDGMDSFIRIIKD